ncbi:unnamed protein product [Penicillium salamii]|uniref:Uncharacterized protein n=1 Tax=Penicillium salamii TaxID=1612424 RepID=A0A9W4NV76_9EURO|nr:unnamed protein product [Penicillium salamii]CAG8355503.1 unnamed protein product [Penicillium salamii]CAG8420521.1 unnamed protein product [Penicillium salamii]
MYATRIMRMQATRSFAFPTPKEPQSGMHFHDLQISPHYFPASAPAQACSPRAVPHFVAICAGIYSATNKILTDKTLRLSRNSPESREH